MDKVGPLDISHTAIGSSKLDAEMPTDPYSPLPRITDADVSKTLDASYKLAGEGQGREAMRILSDLLNIKHDDDRLRRAFALISQQECIKILETDTLRENEVLLRHSLCGFSTTTKIRAMARDYFSAKDDLEYQEYSPVPKMFIGAYTYGVPRIRTWGESACIFIGKFCSIADDVTIFAGGNHGLNNASTYPFIAPIWTNAPSIRGAALSKGDVRIGSDVWIGSGATIMSGVEIGVGCVIAAKSVVAKNVESYSVVVGNPGHIVRRRFDEKTCMDLGKSEWWKWPDELINEAIPHMLSDDIDVFLQFIRDNNSENQAK